MQEFARKHFPGLKVILPKALTGDRGTPEARASNFVMMCILLSIKFKFKVQSSSTLRSEHADLQKR